MSKPKQIKICSIKEYLKLEEHSSVRHEYVRGQIFEMTGSTEAHNIICGNLYVAFHGHLRGTGCRVFQNDMKVRVEIADCFYYPDLMVTCEPLKAKSVFKGLPTVIVEVLSASTKAIDRREKLVAYRQLASLREYVLVHQNRELVEVYRKISDEEWSLEKLFGSEVLALSGVPGDRFSIEVSAIYEGLELPPYVEETEEEYLLN